jgi:hypothetical protein
MAILFVVTEAKDPERLLADALRAQARSAPPAGAAPEALPPRYGLLSGADADSLEREHAALESLPNLRDPVVPPPAPPPPLPLPPPARQLPGYWILLLAVLLGLLTGVVIDLVTLT